MARNRILLAQNLWVLVGTNLATITLDRVGLGNLLMNTVEDDATAERFTRVDVGRHVSQNERVNTYMKATAAGWEIIVDEIGS